MDVVLASVNIGEDLGFLGLALANVDDADFVAVNCIVSIEAANSPLRSVILW